MDMETENDKDGIEGKEGKMWPMLKGRLFYTLVKCSEMWKWSEKLFSSKWLITVLMKT
jgi:hypothetical protein